MKKSCPDPWPRPWAAKLVLLFPSILLLLAQGGHNNVSFAASLALGWVPVACDGLRPSEEVDSRCGVGGGFQVSMSGLA